MSKFNDGVYLSKNGRVFLILENEICGCHYTFSLAKGYKRNIPYESLINWTYLGEL